MPGKLKVGILGATGAVGQRFVSLLEDHPWFEVSTLMASERSVNQKYVDVCHWHLDSKMPESCRDMTVQACQIHDGLDFVFSGLDAECAGHIENDFADQGIPVVSNTKSHRMDKDVPLIIPEINPDHLKLIEMQRKRFSKSGFIVTNPNCSTIVLCLALAPLIKLFGVKNVIVNTLQALSGAGYPGVSSLDIIDNVLPYIPGEEEKMEMEPRKIFGKLKTEFIEDYAMEITARCHRVQVSDGHLLTASIQLKDKREEQELIDSWNRYTSGISSLNLPSIPDRPVEYIDQSDRPQPRQDRWAGEGMTVRIGRLKSCHVLDYTFSALGHNTIRGAAGGSILVAELLAAKGYLS
jgi:aspartate-semialdehyde dehydrogenase